MYLFRTILSSFQAVNSRNPNSQCGPLFWGQVTLNGLDFFGLREDEEEEDDCDTACNNAIIVTASREAAIAILAAQGGAAAYFTSGSGGYDSDIFGIFSKGGPKPSRSRNRLNVPQREQDDDECGLVSNLLGTASQVSAVLSTVTGVAGDVTYGGALLTRDPRILLVGLGLDAVSTITDFASVGLDELAGNDITGKYENVVIRTRPGATVGQILSANPGNPGIFRLVPIIPEKKRKCGFENF